MPNSIGVVRIHQLPENTEPKKTDLLVIENSIDTWHITLERLLNTFVREMVNENGQGVIEYVHDRLENIETIVNNYINNINDMEIKFDTYDEAENIRIENENIRINNENNREIIINEIKEKAHDWEDEEEIRKRNERERISNEDSRINNEIYRINNEEERKTNEINRNLAENTRETNEEIRINNENTRINNEDNRISSFNKMKDYFTALSIAVNRFCNYGISQKTTSDRSIVDIMEISLCGSAHKDYVALLHIQEGPDSNTISNEGIFGLMIKFQRSEDTITDASCVFSVPDRYKDFISSANFNLAVNITGDHIEINIEYNSTSPSVVIFSKVWSNISSYKHENIPIYEKVLCDSQPKSNFSSSSINKSDGEVISYPQGFINFYNNIKKETNASIEAIRPITYWPVGSIYRTSSNKNPNEILGGGTWTLLYDNGIKEVIDIPGEQTPYSVVIYEWERIS